MNLSAGQKEALEFLWFKYGNGGNCHSHANHKFLQLHVEGKHDEAEMWGRQITGDCRDAFKRIVAKDYRELSVTQKQIIFAIENGVV